MHYIFLRVKMAVAFICSLSQKMGLGKMARGQIPNPHRGVHPPNSFYNFYTVEYQCFRMFTL